MLSKLDLLLNALRSANLQVRQVSADAYVAQCPSPTHGTDGYDAHPSLSIRVVGDRILLHCWAGCDPAVILSSLGLSWKDISPSIGCRLDDIATAKCLPVDFLRWLGWRETHRNGVPAIVIPYCNADGIEVATRFRIALTGDRFRWRTGSKLIPYGLSRLDSYNRERPLWVVEGETDTATLWFAGEQAIGLPGKNTISSLEPLTSTLQNFAQIIAWVEPDAEDFGLKIAQTLNRPVKVIYAAKTGAKDINDLWLKCNGDLTFFQQQLETLKQSAEEVFPPSALEPTEAPPLAELLDKIEGFISKFVVLEPHQLTAVTLWVTHTWFVTATNVTPYLWVTSPSKRCGKTRLAEVLFCLANGARFLSSITPAAMFRLIASQPDNTTLIIDEVDNIFASKERSADLTALLNAGFRRGLTVPRVERTGKGEFVIREYPTFSPKVLIGLSRLPDTVADRAIQITLQRKRPTDKVEDFEWDRAENEATPLREGLQAWAQDEEFIQKLRSARPAMPPIASDRAKESWRLLVAIADAAGGDWPARARRAMSQLEQRDEEGLTVRLLAALKFIFDEAGAEFLTTAEIADRLVELDEPPVPDAFLTWHAVGDVRRVGIWLAKTLKPFGVAPVSFWGQGKKCRGFARKDFEEVWRRYGLDNSPDSPPPDPTNQKNGEDAHKEDGRDGRMEDRQYLFEFSPSISEQEDGRVGRDGRVKSPEKDAVSPDTFEACDNEAVRLECPQCGFERRCLAGDLMLGVPRCPTCGEVLQEQSESEPPITPVESAESPKVETSEAKTPSSILPTLPTSHSKMEGQNFNKYKDSSILPSLPSSNKALQKNFFAPNQSQGELFELVIEPDGEPANETATESGFATAVALTDPMPSDATAEPTPPEPTEETSPPAEEEERMVDTLAFLEAAFGPLVDVTPEHPPYPSPPADQFERPWETREERVQRLVRQLFKALRNFQRHYSHYHQNCLNGNLCKICAEFVQKVRKFEQAKDTTELSRLYSANKKWLQRGDF